MEEREINDKFEAILKKMAETDDFDGIINAISYETKLVFIEEFDAD